MNISQPTTQYKPIKINTLGSVMGKPMGVPAPLFGAMPVIKQQESAPPEMPGQGLDRAVNYYADYAGCGWWRMIAPEMLLNINNKVIVSGLTTMVLDPRFYAGIKAVRLQRQATPIQHQFLKFLKQGSDQHKYTTIYEIDDIIIKDDIPDYNRCKSAFESEEILQSCLGMMKLCDEISVTCQYMKEYYMNITGNKKITVIPNYPARMWMDNHYHPEVVYKNYEKNRKKPRIAYVGSGTHIDVANKTNQKDDFAHVVDDIISSRKDIQWVFVGCFPLACKPFIDRGEMEFVQWFPLMELWKAYTTTNVNAVIAPLQNNTFNKAKSNIKYLEAATCGIPAVCQDLITYKDAQLKFNNGSDLIDQIKSLMKDQNTYVKYSKRAREYADTMWLDDEINLNQFKAIYTTPWGSKERNIMAPGLINLNPDQKVLGVK